MITANWPLIMGLLLIGWACERHSAHDHDGSAAPGWAFPCPLVAARTAARQAATALGRWGQPVREEITSARATVRQAHSTVPAGVGVGGRRV
jgi:hypothetical protein